MNKPYFDCGHCGCKTPGVALYRCSLCGAERCGVCCGKGSYHCEESDGDDGTNEGRFYFAGQLCTQEEWNEWLEWKEEQDELAEQQEEKMRQRQIKYEKKLEELGPLFLIFPRKGRSYFGRLVSTDLVCDGVEYSVGELENVSIFLDEPCRCQPNCSVKNGWGKLVDRNGNQRVVHQLYSYVKKRWFLPSMPCLNYWGSITLDRYLPRKDQWVYVKLHMNDLLYFWKYRPKIDELLPPKNELV